jgi:hypothetical protein
MKFGFLTEGDSPRGYSVANRYHEVIREAQYADEMGFDFWGSSEQHFTGPVATISAPEVLFRRSCADDYPNQNPLDVMRDAPLQPSAANR